MSLDTQEEMQQQFEGLLSEPELFSDVTLDVEGKLFPVHKNILSGMRFHSLFYLLFLYFIFVTCYSVLFIISIIHYNIVIFSRFY